MDSRDHAKFKPSASRARARESERKRAIEAIAAAAATTTNEVVEERLTMVDADGAMVYLERERGGGKGGRKTERIGLSRRVHDDGEVGVEVEGEKPVRQVRLPFT